MHQPFRPPTLKLKYFWDSSSTAPPFFWDWLLRFENWFKLQNALCSNARKLPSVVRCRSLVQHLGVEAWRCFTAKFEEKPPTAFDTDFDLLCTILSSIFAADSASHCHAEVQQTLPQQKTLINDTSVKLTLSVECNPCSGSESPLESVPIENLFWSAYKLSFVLFLCWFRVLHKQTC